MTYNGDLSWVTLANSAGAVARVLQQQMRSANAEYEEWQNFRNSRTDAQIATALSRQESEIAEMDSCFSAFKEIYDFANNATSPIQGDRFFSMRKFS